MYTKLYDRFESINYKNCRLFHGEYEETGTQGLLQGYKSFDFEHLIKAGIDVTNVSATIITDGVNAALVQEGDLVEINHKFVVITKKLYYRNPFGANYDTVELIV